MTECEQGLVEIGEAGSDRAAVPSAPNDQDAKRPGDSLRSLLDGCLPLRGSRPAGGLLSSGWDSARPGHAGNLIRQWRWSLESNPNHIPLVLHIGLSLIHI